MKNERAGVYKTAALPTELIRQSAVSLDFRRLGVKPERAESAEIK
jgi:hypothetical protein